MSEVRGNPHVYDSRAGGHQVIAHNEQLSDHTQNVEMYTEREEKARNWGNMSAETGDILLACTHSHSFKTWSRGGVQAHKVRTAVGKSEL
jgi:hypothetical protein